MSKKLTANQLDISCTEKCKHRDHGKSITSAITNSRISDYQLACFLPSICNNYAQVCDYEGRTALHMSASCGRRDLCYWLIKTGKADINYKDQESGYTPLHRSIFYGHINSAVSFIEMGAQVQLLDREDLQANDLALKDRQFKEFSHYNPCQVYVWGTNNNYTLGTGNQDSKLYPELVDFFRKNNISINQAAIDKFHSVFVSSNGRAWACGHGQGGRLGLDSEKTVLKPQQIKTGGEVVISAAVGTNHTILLMESGVVSTCGANNHHVLGHSPPPPYLLSPRPIAPILLKAVGGQICGIAAACYTSVFWTDNSVYTFGLNGGQLGHPLQQSKSIITPKQVTGLSVKCKIVDVSASIGAIVVVVKKGDVYLLHNYQIRRIASKILDVTKVSVFGGELNPEVDQKLSSKGGKELKVMLLTSTGKVLLWQENFPQFTRCIYPSKRSLTFCGLSLCHSSVLFITKEGEAYLSNIKPKQKKKALAPKAKDETLVSFNEFIDKLDCHHLTINKVPYIYRAVGLAADPKGQNFIVIQEHPSANLTDIPIVGNSEFPQQMAALLENAHEDDTLHDVEIEVDKYSVAAHHFVLASSSEEFANMARKETVTTVKLQGVHIEILNQVLLFAYTRNCQMIQPGPFRLQTFEGDIIKAAHDVAKKWKMPILMKCLTFLRYENGLVLLKEEGTCRLLLPEHCWERSMLPTLHDVSVTSSDGATFKAHKCVLAARLEYFNSMFTGGWVEADATNNLSIPIPQIILREIIDFLYKDEVPALAESQDVDYISSVLVVADQLFITKLKQICEVALSGNLSLRNAAYLLQFSITYNADQLKSCCMHFICLNLAVILESRILEILDNKALEDLSRYYRNMIPVMSRRTMTPFSTDLTEEEIMDMANLFPVNWISSAQDMKIDDEFAAMKIVRSNPTPIINKKKARTRKTSDSHRKRLESNSSNSDLDCSVDLLSPEKVDFDDLVERDQTVEKEEWVTVDKTQKAVQDRLKAAVTANTIEPTPERFVKLETTSPPYPSSPPLSHSIEDNKHFPQLSFASRVSSSSKSSSSIEVKRTPIVKLSQKQRKKLLSETGGKEVPCEPVPVQSPWAVINVPDCSLADIMKVGSTLSSDKDQGLVKFSDIVAEEREQRDNWSKMKSKSLQLTQIEDKAMEELHLFYNASNTFDEHITVERVLSANVAKPTWITSRHQ